MAAHDMSRAALRTRASMEHLFILITMGDPLDDEIGTAIFEVLSGIAPDLDPTSIRPDKPLREQVDLDSFDFLNVIIALRERLGIEIPESYYQKLVTLNGMVEYLARRSAAAQVSSSSQRRKSHT